MLSYALLISFGEFWDFASFLYKSDDSENKSSYSKKNKKINIILLRSDTKLQDYLKQILDKFSAEIMRNAISESDMAIMLSCFDNINELSVLPVKPKSEIPNLGETLRTSFDLVMVLVDFKCKSIHSLFDDELFCFFYSLYKRFVDTINKDFRSHLVLTTNLVIDQVFKQFNDQKFPQDHPLKIPVSQDKDYARFREANHAETYFRLIKVTKYLLGSLTKKVSSDDLNKIAYDCMSETLKHLFTCS